MMEGIEGYNGKKVYVVLTSGRTYSGVVERVDDNFVYITDKFGDKVTFRISEISLIEEERR